MSKKLFASESVTEGHPDKICDQISDAVLDSLLAEDRESRVAVEVLATNGLVVVAGEVTTEGFADVQEIVRQKVLEIGYNSSHMGFDGNTCGVLVSFAGQSAEIASGVDTALEVRTETASEARSEAEEAYSRLGAGDQGLMFGYATDENPDFMPTPINLAHLMTKRLAELRKEHEGFDWLYPDGKSQVIVGYEDEKPVSIEHVLISTQHSPDIDLEFVQAQVTEHVIKYVLKEYNARLAAYEYAELDYAEAEFLVNSAGEWNVGGPKSDAGLTGRKIIVDTYGGFARHGGGNFHGKDPSKVDRSAAYALRWVAKNLVAANLAERVELQVSYAIGKAEPLGLYVDTFGTGKQGLTDEQISEIVKAVFDLRPAAIIDELGLKGITNYQQVAKYGHFGANAIELDMPWEQLTKVEELKDISLKYIQENQPASSLVQERIDSFVDSNSEILLSDERYSVWQIKNDCSEDKINTIAERMLELYSEIPYGYEENRIETTYWDWDALNEKTYDEIYEIFEPEIYVKNWKLFKLFEAISLNNKLNKTNVLNIYKNVSFETFFVGDVPVYDSDGQRDYLTTAVCYGQTLQRNLENNYPDIITDEITKEFRDAYIEYDNYREID